LYWNDQRTSFWTSGSDWEKKADFKWCNPKESPAVSFSTLLPFAPSEGSESEQRCLQLDINAKYDFSLSLKNSDCGQELPYICEVKQNLCWYFFNAIFIFQIISYETPFPKCPTAYCTFNVRTNFSIQCYLLMEITVKTLELNY